MVKYFLSLLAFSVMLCAENGGDTELKVEFRLAKQGEEVLKSGPASIVAVAPSNRVIIKSLKKFDPPIYSVGGDIINEAYSAVSFDWWDTYACMFKLDLFPTHKSLSKFMTADAQKIMSDSDFEQIKAQTDLRKTWKGTIHYAIHLEHLNQEFLVIGKSVANHVETMPKNCGYSLMKKVDGKWLLHSYSDTKESLIYKLPLAKFDKMVELTTNKQWENAAFEKYEFKAPEQK